MKHKWHDEIVAWAGGAEIEFLSKQTCTWEIATQPSWETYVQYRIKPQPKEKKYLYGYITNNNGQVIFYDDKKRTENYICKIDVLDD
ncbi:hypothetical protein UFOVP22_29 [uncultured Caudovirales phage]|uniref:Uncharacterized protein n=1 Tax=uncultured Caudovirales phage TaxID=2100421 RepID=A0A6J5T8Q4_9CAUD|nr:hypothetical protein UFOVP22_29 [uncultured Caudovirales phage]